LTTPRGYSRKYVHNPRQIVARPGEAEASKIIGSRGIKTLGGRVQEEYDRLLISWETAVRFYIEMRDDITISTLMSAIKLPLLAAEFDVEAASDSLVDVAARDWLWDAMNNMDRQTWRSHVSDMLEAPEFGFALSEIVLEKRKDGRLWLKNIDPRGQETLRRWEFDEFDHTTAFVQQDPDTGRIATIPMQKTVHVTFGGRKGNPQGRGMYRVLFRTWRFLKNIENLEGIGLERNVGGMPVATLPPEPLSGQDIEDLKAALRDLRMDEEMYLILPNGLTVAPYSGSINTSPLSIVIDRKQKEILQLGFAQFIKLGMSNVGTQALVKGSQDFFTLGLEAIQQQMLDSWNLQLVPFLFRYNQFSFPGMSGFPKITWHQPGKVDIGTLLDAYNKAITAKAMTPIRADEEYFRAEMDLSDLPDGVGEEVRGQEAPPGGGGQPQAPFSEEGYVDYHPGHPDQSIHDPRKGRSASGGGKGLIADKDANDMIQSMAKIPQRKAGEGDNDYQRRAGYAAVSKLYPGKTADAVETKIFDDRFMMEDRFAEAANSFKERKTNDKMYDGWGSSSTKSKGGQQLQASVATIKEGSSARFTDDLEAMQIKNAVGSEKIQKTHADGLSRALAEEEKFWKKKLGGPNGELTVYRGVTLPQDYPVGDQIIIADTPVSSWTASPAAAMQFGDTVIARKVKAKDIVGSFATRSLVDTEFEIMTYNQPEGVDTVVVGKSKPNKSLIV
jgi:hypothetical protein